MNGEKSRNKNPLDSIEDLICITESDAITSLQTARDQVIQLRNDWDVLLPEKIISKLKHASYFFRVGEYKMAIECAEEVIDATTICTKIDKNTISMKETEVMIQKFAISLETQAAKILQAIPRDGLHVFMKVQKDGRACIPSETREILKIEEGDIMEMKVDCIYRTKDTSYLWDKNTQSWKKPKVPEV